MYLRDAGHLLARLQPDPMAKLDVTIPTADGTCGATLHVPDGANPAPAVIMYPDAGGARDTFREMGDRLAAEGFVVLVPDVYYRVGPVPPFRWTPCSPTRASASGSWTWCSR